jgi:hypothetical protein
MLKLIGFGLATLFGITVVMLAKAAKSNTSNFQLKDMDDQTS